jgi:hypothetical protein
VPATQARVAVASTMAASMVGATGVAVAAQEALPGDALYGVKKATESLRLSLAGDPSRSVGSSCGSPRSASRRSSPAARTAAWLRPTT